MAIAMVGSEGTVAATGTPITPAIPQSSTTGNLLVAWVVGLSGTTAGIVSSTSNGWLQAVEVHSGQVAAAIWYRPNCGAAEANPTFTSSTSTVMHAKVDEFSGADASAPMEQSGSNTGTTTPLSLACGATDALTGNLIAACVGLKFGVAKTPTLTDSLNNGASVIANSNDGAVSGTNHYDICAYGITTSHASVDTDSFSFTAANITTASGVIASFRPVPISVIKSPVTYGYGSN